MLKKKKKKKKFGNKNTLSNKHLNLKVPIFLWSHSSPTETGRMFQVLKKGSLQDNRHKKDNYLKILIKKDRRKIDFFVPFIQWPF